MEPPLPKNRKLDFNRPTFNEPMIKLPVKQDVFRMPSSFADDEESINESRDSITSLASSTSTVKHSENVSVFLRLRPTPAGMSNSLYLFSENDVVIPQASANHATNTEKHYTFTSILEEDQVEMYEKIVRPILSKPFATSGATFASYGCSNSGKTFTILGESSPGLVPRALTQIYSEFGTEVNTYPCVKISPSQNLCEPLSDDETGTEMDNVVEFIAQSRKSYKNKRLMWDYEEIIKEHNFKQQPSEPSARGERLFIWLSLVEIYNDKITDLLSIEKGTISRALKIFSNAGNSYVHGATWLYAADLKTAFDIINYGLCKVSYASTGVNSRSSRSHTIFTIQIISEVAQETDYMLSSYKFCDLAGAERLKKTGNVGERLKEAGGINNSLLVLGRCLEAVINNQKKGKKQAESVVPVRDSKLTLLIQSSLLGHEKFIMIVNLSPTAEFFDENLNVLKFGSIASQIVVKKAETKKFKRKSTRYSLFHNDVGSPKKNSTFNDTLSSIDESELDDSFKWNHMSADELRHLLRIQKIEICVLKCKIEEREREALLSERQHMQQILNDQEAIREKFHQRNEENEKYLTAYHEKKLESQKIKYERMLSESYGEIDRLNYIIDKMRKNGQNALDDVDIDEDDVYEIEDDEEEEEESILS